MSPLISCEGISKAHGSLELFKNLTLSIFKGDRIGLIGPNGAGKSTLLKILVGLEHPDAGQVVVQKQVRVGYVPQESNFPGKSIKQILREAFTPLTATEEHEIETHIDVTMGRMGFEDPDILATHLSGGWKKRLEIAKQLVTFPDVLLLDEPTNHLDLNGILWLEKFLLRQNFAYLVISHDRYFLENISSKVIEINPAFPKGMFGAEGPYSNFLEKRELFLAGQAEQEKSLNSKVRREIEWLKQNPKARTTKSRSRIQEAERLQRELGEIKGRNQQTNTSEISFSSTDRETRKLLTVKNLAKSMGGKTLFSGVDLNLSPGLRLGLVGANGTGKSTFLKLLSGQIAPDMGTLKRAEGVQTVLFDQHREQLPLKATLRSALSPEGDWVHYRGRTIHVNGWCKKFLFSPDRLDLPVSRLSGGERARILIARLMLKTADILLLDEPTNDLDIPTLEVLEESLREFPGAVVLITHDRYILEETCNLLLGFPGNGKAAFVADYGQWEELLENQKREPAAKSEPKKTSSAQPVKPGAKLSYKEKKELDEMESRIAMADAEVDRCRLRLEDPALANRADALQEACLALHKAEEALNNLYIRWQELEEKQNK